MKPYRLGIDVGVASIGCVAFALNKKRQPTDIIHCATRIFQEPLQPAKSGGVGEPKKAQRRLARQARRQHQRRSARLRNIAALAGKIGVDRTTTLADSGQTIHKIRARAVDEPITPEDLLRVFLHMAKRRGYMGIFREPKATKTKKDQKPTENTATPAAKANNDQEITRGQVKQGVAGLRKRIGKGTLGQYLQKRLEEGKHLRLKDDGLFADKAMVEDEFNRIWGTQAKTHSILKNDELREEFHNAIFFKRPLRSPAPMVGHCELETDLPRAPKAHPAEQAFRIEQAIRDLKFYAPRQREQELSSEQRDIIRELLDQRHEIKFQKIKDKMHRAGCPIPEGKIFNFEKGGRESWKKGNKTSQAMGKLGLLEKWNALNANHQTTVINLLADTGSPDEVFNSPDWNTHMACDKTKSYRKFADEVVAFINEMAAHPKFDRLSKMGFDTGRARYSIKALRKLTERMREDDIDLTQAKQKEYPGSIMQKGDQSADQAILSPPEPTNNTVVDVALRQFRRTINNTIQQLSGPPAEVIIELSRDIALGLTKRGEIDKINRKKEKARKEAAEEIENHTGKPASNTQIRRYLLWAEQEKRWCPYCTKKTINLGDALDGNVTEYEHIMPKSVSRIGKQRACLVLAHKECNQKKENKTPWQAWGEGRGTDRWQAIREHAEHYEKNKMRAKARQLLYEGNPLDSSMLQDFSERQFQETSWISKICAQWLSEICPRSRIYVSRGRWTAHLRHHWGLENVIPELRYEAGLPVLDDKSEPISCEDFRSEAYRKRGRRIDKRIDHRHHLIDAIVIGLTDLSLFQKMTKQYQELIEDQPLNEDGPVPELPDPPSPPVSNLHCIAREKAKDLANLSHAPDRRPAGPMFDQNAYTEWKNENGQSYYARRTHLKDLTTEAQINRIVDPQTRNAVLEAFRRRVDAGEKPKDALQKGVEHPNGTVVRHVLLAQNDRIKEDTVRVKHRARDPKIAGRMKTLRKILKPDGYAYMEVDKETKRKILVRLNEATARPSQNRKRFYKNDTVCGPATNRMPYLIRQFNVVGGGSLFLTLATETREFGQIRKGETVSSKTISAAKKLLELEVING